MLWIRISAVMALLWALLEIAAIFMPLFYKIPVHFEIYDVISVVTTILLLAGAYFAVMRANSSVLLAAWSWFIALQASALVHAIANPNDFGATLSRITSSETREVMRQQFERAHEMDIQMASFYFALPLIGLILLIVGRLRITQTEIKYEG